MKKRTNPSQSQREREFFFILFFRLNNPCNRCVRPTKVPACLRGPDIKTPDSKSIVKTVSVQRNIQKTLSSCSAFFEADRPLDVPFDRGFEPCFLAFCWRACWCFDIVVAPLWMGDFDSWDCLFGVFIAFFVVFLFQFWQL